MGRTWGGACELQQLWVAPPQRGRGLGTALLRAFEDRASSRGCLLVYLDTFSFMAPDFYRRLGYREVLRNASFPHGIVKFTMQRELAPGAPPPASR